MVGDFFPSMINIFTIGTPALVWPGLGLLVLSFELLSFELLSFAVSTVDHSHSPLTISASPSLVSLLFCTL
jgi:hypothetical protein